MTNPVKPIKYFKVKKISSEYLLEFQDLTEFHRFVEYHQVRSLFLFLDAKNVITHFATSYKGGLLQQPANGYKTIEDYSDAFKNGFPDAESYYASKEMGYASYEDYSIVMECGISDKRIFDKLKSLGYSDGFKDYISLKNENGIADALGHYENAYQLYTEATANGFERYETFKEARKKGFKNQSTYTISKEKGYDNAVDFETAQEKGFLNYEEYKSALELKVRDRADMVKYSDLLILKERAEFDDQRVLLTILSKLPQGKKVSINKLNEHLEKGYEEFRYSDTNEMPLWFSRGFEGRDSIIKYLRSNDGVKEYGQYDVDGEYFETKKLQDRKVVIDGSNVAHGSMGNKTSQATFANLLLMIKTLKGKGINEITVISDAALKHRIIDKEKLDLVKEECEYLESPAEMPADIFIIKYVKMHHCLLVSNDTFREWKHNDPWVAENIDFYRLTFMINNDKVIIPDMD